MLILVPSALHRDDGGIVAKGCRTEVARQRRSPRKVGWAVYYDGVCEKRCYLGTARVRLCAIYAFSYGYERVPSAYVGRGSWLPPGMNHDLSLGRPFQLG